MHINVEGTGIKKISPNEIILNLDFVFRSKNFEEAFKEGTSSVEDFINHVLLPNNYKKEDLVTKNFSITSVDEFSPTANKMVFSHYLYKQEGEFKFEYDLDKLSLLLTQISSLKKPPLLRVTFSNNNIEEYKKEALKRAYDNALTRAKVIARSANKEIKEALKTDFRPHISPLRSETQFDQGLMTFKSHSPEVVSTIKNIFTPSDIEVKEFLNVLFLAE